MIVQIMNPMLFTHFYLVVAKNLETPISHIQKEKNILALNPQLFCQQIDKTIPTGRMNC